MTADIRPRWLNVTRSLQKAACKNNGIAVVTSRIIIDNGGDPVTWTEPDVTKLGPLSSQDDLIRLLSALSASSASVSEDFLLAKVIDDAHLAINKGKNGGVTDTDWFVYLDIAIPYAILCVDELRDRITILRAVWVAKTERNILKVGEPLYRIHW